jgi:transcription antitermination factor NusA-like protein
MGQEMKFTVFRSGTIAQMIVKIFQQEVPKIAKKTVEPKITPTAPQQ